MHACGKMGFSPFLSLWPPYSYSKSFLMKCSGNWGGVQSSSRLSSGGFCCLPMSEQLWVNLSDLIISNTSESKFVKIYKKLTKMCYSSNSILILVLLCFFACCLNNNLTLCLALISRSYVWYKKFWQPVEVKQPGSRRVLMMNSTVRSAGSLL